MIYASIWTGAGAENKPCRMVAHLISQTYEFFWENNLLSPYSSDQINSRPLKRLYLWKVLKMPTWPPQPSMF